MRTTLIGLFSCTVVMITGCSPAPTPVQAVRVSSGASPVIHSTHPTVPPLPVVKVKKPWQPRQFQNGIQLYWHTLGTDTQLRAAAAKTLNYIVGLGANSVGISFPLYLVGKTPFDGQYPVSVQAGVETPNAASLGIILAAAKERGLRVTLRPLIDETNVPTKAHPEYWRGSIQPVDVVAWFKSYDQLIVQYAAIAAKYAVQELVAGTELFSLQPQTAQWQSLIGQIKLAGYNGTVSYAVNWNDWTTVPFQTLGLDAYPAVPLGDNATIPQLASALSNWFDQQPLSVRSRLTVQEAGIPAQSGMYKHPWWWGITNAPLNLKIQVNWFSAVCLAAKASKIQGLYYWMLDSNVDPSLPNAAQQPTSSFVGRPSEQSIKSCFSS